MKSKKVNIAEKNSDLKASKSMVLELIETQINNYKLQHMKDWVGDHTASPNLKDEKIKMLEEQKKEIAALYQSCSVYDSLVDVNISIDLTIKESLSVAV